MQIANPSLVCFSPTSRPLICPMLSTSPSSPIALTHHLPSPPHRSPSSHGGAVPTWYPRQQKPLSSFCPSCNSRIPPIPTSNTAPIDVPTVGHLPSPKSFHRHLPLRYLRCPSAQGPNLPRASTRKRLHCRTPPGPVPQKKKAVMLQPLLHWHLGFHCPPCCHARNDFFCYVRQVRKSQIQRRTCCCT